MLLVIDIGNTNITLGLYQEEKLAATFRMTTRHSMTSDEYGVMICDLLEHRGFSSDDVEDVIVASVVPDIMHSLLSAIIKYMNCKPLVVGPGIKTGIRITTENPREIGADRIVDVVAAYTKYGGPVIVVDFGTATTYDLVEADGSFGVGITSPGIRASARALWGDTAMLPEVEIRKPASILAHDTITSMQAGLVYGTIGQSEYIISQIKKEAKVPDARVIATGGLGRIISKETDIIDVYDVDLTLEGLRIIYEKNRKRKQ